MVKIGDTVLVKAPYEGAGLDEFTRLDVASPEAPRYGEDGATYLMMEVKRVVRWARVLQDVEAEPAATAEPTKTEVPL